MASIATVFPWYSRTWIDRRAGFTSDKRPSIPIIRKWTKSAVNVQYVLTNNQLRFHRNDKRMFTEFCHAPSSLDILLQTFDNKVFTISRNDRFRRKLYICDIQNNVFSKKCFLSLNYQSHPNLCHIFSKGLLSIYHLLKNHSYRPHINLLGY